MFVENAYGRPRVWRSTSASSTTHTEDSSKRAECSETLEPSHQEKPQDIRTKLDKRKSTNLHFRADTGDLEEREEENQTSPKTIRLLGVAVYVHLALRFAAAR
jgi:hypothetical protein